MAVLLTAAIDLRAQPRGGAQPAAPPADAIRCWWRTSQGAVAVGEPFTLVLTCAVREGDGMQVVPDESRLAVGMVQLAPFEVLRGNHPPDVRAGAYRFLQYDYTLRVIDPDLIGRDAQIVDLQIHYRINRAGASAEEGRERIYVLPGMAIRVLSLVPQGAADIRDAGEIGFARIGELQFRARVLEVIAIALAVLAAIVGVPAIVAALARGRRREASEVHRVSDRELLSAAAEALTAAEREAQGTWTPEIAARALSGLRLAAACALDQPVGQRPHAKAAAVADGRTLVASSVWRRQPVTVSSAVTSRDVARALEGGSLAADRRPIAEALREAMDAFTGAVYSRSGGPSAASGRSGGSLDPPGPPDRASAPAGGGSQHPPLHEAVRAARAAIAQLQRQTRWRVRAHARERRAGAPAR